MYVLLRAFHLTAVNLKFISESHLYFVRFHNSKALLSFNVYGQTVHFCVHLSIWYRKQPRCDANSNTFFQILKKKNTIHK